MFSWNKIDLSEQNSLWKSMYAKIPVLFNTKQL